MKRKYAVIVVLFLCLFIVQGCHSHKDYMPESNIDEIRDLSEEDFEVNAYVLDYGDRFRISVWPQKKYSRKVTIDLQGEIFYPPMGRLFILGKTLDEFTEMIEEGLHRYLVNPVIKVKIVRSLTNRVYLFGQVKNPGIYSYGIRYKRILGVIAKAAGPQRDADLKHVVLIRDVLTNPTYTYLNLKDCYQGISFKDNVIVLPGDFIFFPRTKLGDSEAFIRHATMFVRFAWFAERTFISGPRVGNAFVDIFGPADFTGSFEE